MLTFVNYQNSMNLKGSRQGDFTYADLVLLSTSVRIINQQWPLIPSDLLL